MSFGKITLDKADTMFSRYIRVRDKFCQRCGRKGEPNKDSEFIIGLQNSHYFGRGIESTRFDPDNCDALCAGCHQIWGSDDREAYRRSRENFYLLLFRYYFSAELRHRLFC